MTLLIVLYTIMFTGCVVIVMLWTQPSRSAKALRLRLDDIRDPRRTLSSETSLGFKAEDGRSSLITKLTIHLHEHPISFGLSRLLLQAHSKQDVGAFILISVGTAFLIGTGCALASRSIPCTIVGTLLGLLFRYLWLLKTRSRLLAAFSNALPDAIDLMARALRAGHSTQQAIELIAEQTPQPLCSEFAQVHQEQKFGLPFRDALLDMSLRVPSKDLSFFVTAILVQKETGSDLIEILDRTTRVIRDRVRVAGEIRTYTAQGRLTGWILSLLPVLMLGVISILSPSYVAPLFDDPLGQKLLIGGSLMIAVGSFLIRRIVAVEI